MKALFKVVGALLAVVVLGYGFIHFQFQQKSQKVYIPPKVNIHEKVLAADPELGHRIYAVRSGCIDCHGGDATIRPAPQTRDPSQPNAVPEDCPLRQIDTGSPHATPRRPGPPEAW